MKCPKCQFENREGARFCNQCGHRFGLVCPECGANNKVGSKFCDECGHNLEAPKEAPPIDFSQPRSYTPKFLADKILTNRSAMEGERKQVTVLFADVANYTSISEKIDPEEVHQIMDGCFKILMDEIHKYEGTINQFTGDGVMALFGAPVAHENHAQRACYAALSIQKAIEEYGKKVKEDCGVDFLMRIGLNSGPVIVGSIGDDLRMDYTAVGDTTNLASRMENMAKPGTILGTIYTHRLAKDYFEFESLDKVQVKGKKEPVEAYQVIKPSEIETRIEAAAAKGLTEFVGRKKEMEILKEAFEKACTGLGQVVGIVGEAGVGKSRLLLELKGILPKGEYTYLEGRCLHYGSSMPYLPISDILRRYFEIKEGDRVFVVKKKVEEKILQLDERLKSNLPPIQELLSLKVEDSAYLQLEPQQKRQRCFEAIRDLLVRESERKPLVLVVDDLHWIDRSSEEFLGYLVDWLANAKVLLILLYRPEYTHAWGSKSYYSKIGVDQLSTKSSAKLVQNILEGGEVVPELRELIIDRAGGNPLFVEELTHSLLENGSIQRKDHQYVLARQASEIEVPDTIQGIIAARIDHVEESLKRIVQVASVIGREFAYRILQTIMGMREELKSSLLNLQGLEFIYEKRLFPELEYIFKHALTQEVAYNSLLIKRRKEIHEKIGSAIEDLYPDRLEEYYEMLAHHYVLSDNRKKALEYLARANQKAARVNALQEAMSYFDKAMEILDSFPETESNQQRRISLLVDQWVVFQLSLRFSEYYDLLNRYEAMATELGNQELLGMFYARLGACQWWFGHLDQATKTLTKAAELCEAAGAHEDLGFAYMTLQWSYLWKGDFAHVLTLKEAAIGQMEKQFNLRPYVLALTGASWAYSHTGSWDNAVKEAEKGLKVAEEYSNNSLISFAAFALSVACTLRGDLSNALEYGEQAVEVAPTPADKVWAQTGLAWALCRLGDPYKGVEVATNLASMYHAVRFFPAEIYTIITLGEGHWRCGDNGAATQRLHEGLELAERTGMRFLIGYACRLLGETTVKVNPEQAMNHFMQSIAMFQEVKAENELALAYAGYGRFHKRQGNMEQARENLTKALGIFEKLGTLGEPDKVRQELAQVDQGSDK
jgi:class 3 adenylate cyclase/tetratricopeptide (TPR) repeat protein/energy-coupling factor transporter ATP-binding protein EcfA2